MGTEGEWKRCTGKLRGDGSGGEGSEANEGANGRGIQSFAPVLRRRLHGRPFLSHCRLLRPRTDGGQGGALFARGWTCAVVLAPHSGWLIGAGEGSFRGGGAVSPKKREPSAASAACWALRGVKDAVDPHARDVSVTHPPRSRRVGVTPGDDSVRAPPLCQRWTQR